MITAQEIAAAMIAANQERHDSEQAYMAQEISDVTDGELADFLIDGRINLKRVAELLG